MWTDLIQTGVANWDGWLYPALESQNDYFNNFVPANPTPTILQSVALASWDGPSSGITIVGVNGNTGERFRRQALWLVHSSGLDQLRVLHILR